MLHHNKNQTKFLNILFRNIFKKEADYRLCSYNQPLVSTKWPNTHWKSGTIYCKILDERLTILWTIGVIGLNLRYQSVCQKDCLMSFIHFLSKIFFMIKWTLGFFVFLGRADEKILETWGFCSSYIFISRDNG